MNDEDIDSAINSDIQQIVLLKATFTIHECSHVFGKTRYLI